MPFSPNSSNFSKFITDQLRNINVTVSRLKLLYRASRDGWEHTDIYRMCDNKGATVVLVKSTTNHIFGGFAQNSWISPSSQTWMTDNKAFLFSWNHREIYSQPRTPTKLSIIVQVGDPCVGSENDLGIYTDCNANNTSYATMNTTYSTKGRNRDDITGRNSYRVEECEVWSVME